MQLDLPSSSDKITLPRSNPANVMGLGVGSL